MWAEKLARESKIDFALISGPSCESFPLELRLTPLVDQFSPNEAIVEIKNLFKWAKSKRKGFIMFIDEADSFLEDRSTLNPDRVRVLNEYVRTIILTDSQVYYSNWYRDKKLHDDLRYE